MPAEPLEPRLFRGPVSALTIHAHRDNRGQWIAVLRTRCEGEGWDETPADVYELLTTGELLDVLEVAVEQKLLPGR